MNTVSPTIVRHRANVQTVFECPSKLELYSPREDNKKNLYVCSRAGEIIKFTEKGEYSIILSLAGQPSCLAFDLKEEEKSQMENDLKKSEDLQDKIYFTDVANSIIYSKKPGQQEDLEVLVKDYENYPLKGPTSLALNFESNSIIFCDGGYFESTSLSRPTGSVFNVELDSQTITPILLNCLAYPADIFYDNMIGIGYIAETFANRILRITENQGIYHANVFYVFNGRVGPTSLSCDEEGNIYVSRYEYQNKEGKIDGIISVINKDGVLLGEIQVPGLPEITGMFIPRKFEDESKEEENNNNNNNKAPSLLYFTEKNFNGVKKIDLTQFKNEIDKL